MLHWTRCSPAIACVNKLISLVVPLYTTYLTNQLTKPVQFWWQSRISPRRPSVSISPGSAHPPKRAGQYTIREVALAFALASIVFAPSFAHGLRAPPHTPKQLPIHYCATSLRAVRSSPLPPARSPFASATAPRLRFLLRPRFARRSPLAAPSPAIPLSRLA